MLVKAVLTSTSLATGFEGGPVFPLLFIGAKLGLALSKILPFIPQGVGVTAGMAGVESAAFPSSVDHNSLARTHGRTN